MINGICNVQGMTTVIAEFKKVVSKSEEANVILYATEIDKKDGMYRKFEMEIDEGTRYFPYWINVTNPTYAPRILYNDLNQDGKKDLVQVFWIMRSMYYMKSKPI
ncbi:hypothetical protein [Peribacillus loiseleuriae]|uniref:hypothetical protein n=1 Tax=Peribacillus loiseleuriae TaxID=1679170 RepID=UPI003D08E5C7